MKALSLSQPWAWMMVHGPKRIENRPWPAPKAMIGERFAMHAARSWDQESFEDILGETYGAVPHGFPRDRKEFQAGGIIGVATLDRCVQLSGGLIPAQYELDQVEPDQQRFFFGPYGFVLSGMIALPRVVPCAGALSFWRVPDDIEYFLQQALAS